MTVRYIQTNLRALRAVVESTFEADPGSGYSLMRNAQEIVWTPDQTKYAVEPQKSSEMRGPDMSVSGGKGGTITWKTPLNTKGASSNRWPNMMAILGAGEPPFDYEYTARKLATITTPVSTTTFTIPSSADFVVGRPVIHRPTVVCTLDGTANTVTKSSHGLSDGQAVMFINNGGALPTEISATTTYYVRDAATDTFKIATTPGGTALDFTGNGTGTHYYSRTASLRWVTRITDAGGGNSTITVNRAFDITPAAGHSVEYSASLQPTSGVTKTFTIHAYGGQGTTHRFRLVATGCAVMFKLATTGPKALPVLEFTANISSWSYSETNLAQTDLAENAPVSILGGLVYINGSAVAVRSIGFDPGVAIAEIESLDTNGRSGWNCSNSVPKIDIGLLHDTDILDKWSNNTEVSIEFNRYTDALNCWGFWIPKAQIVKAPHEDAGGILGIKPEILVVDPGSNADGTLYPLWNFAMSGY